MVTQVADQVKADADVIPVLRDRWSPSSFDPGHHLGDAQIHALLEAARWAPSCGNTQPWAFIVGRRGGDTHEAICHLLSRGNSTWAPRASLLIVTLQQLETVEGHDLPFPDYAGQDLGQACAHLTVQAHGMGLMAHQFAGFDHERAQEVFRVPPAWKVRSGIAVGQHLDPHDQDPYDQGLVERESRRRRRRPLSEFVFGGHFGEPLAGAGGHPQAWSRALD